MTSTVHERALSATKHLALVLAVIGATGCVSNGSNAPSSTSTADSTPTAVSSSSPSGTSAASSTSGASNSQSSSSSTSATTASSSSTTASNSGRTSGGSASLVFSFTNGLSAAANVIQTAASAKLIGSVVSLSSASVGQHQAGAVWYKTPQNVQSFTTDFTFQLDPSAFGITFCVQNSNSTTDPMAFGDYASADANMLGYGAYTGQSPILNSVAIKFDLTGANDHAYLGATPNGTGLYINGGPDGMTGFMPENDLNPSGVNLHSGDIMDAHIVYDGSVLTLTLRDTNTNAQSRMSWPVDIPAVMGGDYAWVGLTAGTIPAVSQSLLTWSYWQGFNQELAAPTFSVPAGQYSSSQTVTITGPAGATIYYTTNGEAPTTSSAQYTGPITVSSSTIVQAVAVESGYTDSAVASSYFQIAVNGTPTINFPSGFSGASNLIMTTGVSALSGSSIQLTDTANNTESGAAWFVAPMNVQAFTTNFTVNLSGPANANGFTFTIQNQNPSSTDAGSKAVSGGPTTVGMPASGLGYQGIKSSVAVVFDLYDGSGSITGLYYNGENPTTNTVDMSSSLSLHSGHPFGVTIAYNGTTLTMTIKDTVTGASFSHVFQNVDIPTSVGSNTAYVGFTGGTGGQTALQDVTSWTFSN